MWGVLYYNIYNNLGTLNVSANFYKNSGLITVEFAPPKGNPLGSQIVVVFQSNTVCVTKVKF